MKPKEKYTENPNLEVMEEQAAFPKQNMQEGKGRPLNQAKVFGQDSGMEETLAKPAWVALVAVVIALAADLMIYNYRLGLQWAIFVNLLLLGALTLSFILKKPLPWQSWALSGLTSILAILSAVRNEGLSSAGLSLLSFTGLVILAISYLGGQWMAYRLREHLLERIKLFISAFIALPVTMINLLCTNEGGELSQRHQDRRKLRGLAVGVMIALPFVLLLGALLASADEAFSHVLDNMLSCLQHLDNLKEAFNQAFLVAFLTWLIFGVYAHAFTKSSIKVKAEPDSPLFRPFLGTTEATVVLASLNLLFALFLFVQVRYFFAGQEAVKSLGLSYSSYAVKGFNELIMVACLVLVIHYGFSAVTRRSTPKQKRVYSLLASLLVLQVGVVLISAHLRLALYEQVYGYTQLRLISHLFIPFVGLLLLASVIMELWRGFKYMALVLFLLAVSFGLCLAFVNVDATIARLNLARADTVLSEPKNGEQVREVQLDYSYLIYELSEDALPVLAEKWRSPQTDPEQREVLAKVLACRWSRFRDKMEPQQAWFAYDLSEHLAIKTYAALQDSLPAMQQKAEGREGLFFDTIHIDGETYYCGQYRP